MTKTFWLICGGLFFILSFVIGQQLTGPRPKKIFGVETNLPQLQKEDLNFPPKKNSSGSSPDIRAKAAILIDVVSFQELYQKNPDLKVPIASTVKIMTSMVVLEDYPDKMKDIVTITRDMVNVEGSDIQLRSGEKMAVEDLLKGLLIMSGNDAAYSLASYLGGKENFVKKMNDKASFLGLKDTLYKDPAGLNDEGYSTARDLAILSTYALRHPDFSNIVRTPQTIVTSLDGIVHEFKSSNRMLRAEEQFYYPYAIGIKTGFTNQAGHVLVSCAEKDGHRLISVILNTDENTVTASAKESKKLLEWGFSNWIW